MIDTSKPGGASGIKSTSQTTKKEKDHLQQNNNQLESTADNTEKNIITSDLIIARHVVAGIEEERNQQQQQRQQEEQEYKDLLLEGADDLDLVEASSGMANYCPPYPLDTSAEALSPYLNIIDSGNLGSCKSSSISGAGASSHLGHQKHLKQNLKHIKVASQQNCSSNVGSGMLLGSAASGDELEQHETFGVKQQKILQQQKMMTMVDKEGGKNAQGYDFHQT